MLRQETAFAILTILLTRRKVSRDYLAERFSVCKRTVSRYILLLEDAGVPIESTPGRNGGIAIADDYMIDRTFLTQAETARIRDALLRTADDYDDKANAAITEKLDMVNKSRESDGYVIKQENLYIDCAYEQAAAIKPRIKLLEHAIDSCRAVDIKYTDAHGFVSYRTIEPYTLVFKTDAWYIYAMCKLRGDFRLFRLSRISDLRLTSRRFVKYESKLEEKLELENYNELYVDLEFEFYSSVRESVVNWLGENAVTERGTKLIASAEVPFTSSLIKKLLSFGSSVKVLGPPELRQKICEEAKRMCDAYTE